MAFTRHSHPAVDEVQPYLHGVAKHLVDQIWGPNGHAWGTKFSEIEDLVVAVQQVLSKRLLLELLAVTVISPTTDSRIGRRRDRSIPGRPSNKCHCAAA